MTRTLRDRLDDACARHGLEWVILPSAEPEPNGYHAVEAWRHGPYWCALVMPGPHRSGYRQFYAYNGLVKGREDEPDPEVVFIHPGPLTIRQAKKVLLAELGG
jgi:hypothetical protein